VQTELSEMQFLHPLRFLYQRWGEVRGVVVVAVVGRGMTRLLEQFA